MAFYHGTLKEQLKQKLKFCDYLLALMSVVQPCMSFFLLWNIKGEVWKNVDTTFFCKLKERGTKPVTQQKKQH